jgi:hypothetical protein
MPTYPVKSIVDGQPTFETPLDAILGDLKAGGAIKTLTAAEYITERQRAWWKGILLPSLAKHTGDSIEYWETRLKLAVLPEEFQPYYVPMGKQVFPVVPSITKLSKKKMTLLIEGSVGHLHDEQQYLRGNTRYGDEFLWVTLPDPELRR